MPVSDRTKKLLNALQGPPSPNRTTAADRLLNLSENHFDRMKLTTSERSELASALVLFANDREILVRRCVAQLLGPLRCWGESVEKSLIELLNESQPEVQVHAVWAIGNIKHHSDALCSAIARLSGSSSHDVRWRAAWVLGELGCKSMEARASLQELSDDSSYLTRMHSIEAMWRCVPRKDNHVVACILRALRDDDPSVRGAACKAIAELEWNWDGALSVVRQIALHDMPAVQAAAMLALVRHLPGCKDDPLLRAWLNANRDYWWANEYLSSADA